MAEPLPVVSSSAEDVAGWSEEWPMLMRIADAWSRRAPRARNALPRFIGRTFGRSWRVKIMQHDGASLALEPSSLDIYLQIARTGTWDDEVLDVCLAILMPGNVFYDIGANVGFMSITAGARKQDKIQVFAFEPQRELALAIARSANLSKLNNVTVLCTMLGSEAGEAELFVGSHTIHASAIAREQGSRVVKCPINALDELVESGSIAPPDLIKIDVEGAELRVFDGAQNVLQTYQPAIVFEADENLERFGTKPSDVINYLAGRFNIEYSDIAELDTISANQSVGAARSTVAEFRRHKAWRRSPSPRLIVNSTLPRAAGSLGWRRCCRRS